MCRRITLTGMFVVGQNYVILRRIQPAGDSTYKDKEVGDCFEGWLVVKRF